MKHVAQASCLARWSVVSSSTTAGALSHFSQLEALGANGGQMADETNPAIDIGDVVGIRYTVKNGEGVLIDTCAEGEPLRFLVGGANVVEGLENACMGHRVGDEFTVVVPPEEGYGRPDGLPTQRLDPKIFPGDVELSPGMPVGAHDSEGEPVTLWITKVEDEIVYADTDHPLAGVTLHFTVAVVSVRRSTADERTAGEPAE